MVEIDQHQDSVVDWSDFSAVEHAFNSSGEGPNPLGVNVDLRDLDSYGSYHKGDFDKALEGTDGKAWHEHNGILGMLSSKPDGSHKLMLLNTSGMNPYDQEEFGRRLSQEGYQQRSFNVPHSSDGGAWMSRAPRYGETTNAYADRLRGMYTDMAGKNQKYVPPKFGRS